MWRGRRGGSRSSGSSRSTASSSAGIDVYTKEHLPDLSPAAQGQVGIVNAKRLWKENQRILEGQEAPAANRSSSSPARGRRISHDPPDKYVSAFAGSDIETNPPATNAAVQAMPDKTFTRMVDKLPPQAVLDEIDKKVDFQKLEEGADGGRARRNSPTRTRVCWRSSPRKPIRRSMTAGPPMSESTRIFDAANARPARTAAGPRPFDDHSQRPAAREKSRWAATARCRTATPS